MPALERTIALHFLRTGQFDTAETFLEVSWNIATSPACSSEVNQESGIEISSDLRSQFLDLHRILRALRNQDISPALEFVPLLLNPSVSTKVI